MHLSRVMKRVYLVVVLYPNPFHTGPGPIGLLPLDCWQKNMNLYGISFRVQQFIFRLSTAQGSQTNITDDKTI